MKEVSISFGRKKICFSDLEVLGTQQRHIFYLYSHCSCQTAPYSCPTSSSGITLWVDASSLWEAWRTSTSNSRLENEMPALLPVMPCQQMGPCGWLIMESKVVTPKETSTHWMIHLIHSHRKRVSQLTLLSAISIIRDFYTFKTKTSKVHYGEAQIFQDFNYHNKDIFIKIT